MNRRFQTVQGPSQLADLNGRRRPGHSVQVTRSSKAPKRRFNIGDRFEFEGAAWEIIYMYRMANEPGVWIHCLEDTREPAIPSPATELLGAIVQMAGAGATTPRIVFNAFKHEQDVHTYFLDIYRNGDSVAKTTQQLLKMRKLN